MATAGYGSIEVPTSFDGNKNNNDFSFFGSPEDMITNREEETSGKSAPIHALFNLCKVFIGIGILTGPYAMSH